MGGITGFLGWLERARVSEASNWVMNCNCLDSWWSLLVASSNFGLIGLGFAEDFDCRENFMVQPSRTKLQIESWCLDFEGRKQAKPKQGWFLTQPSTPIACKIQSYNDTNKQTVGKHKTQFTPDPVSD
jgi:hypothetical protein